MNETEALKLDAGRCALLVQDLQNDVITEGGAWSDSGAPQHAKEQNVVENVKRLAQACRDKGVPVIHVWYIVEEGARGLKINAPLFEGVKGASGLVRGTWGAAPADGLEPQDGDFVVEKMRMSAWQGTKLQNLIAGRGRDPTIVPGAEAHMAVENTARSAQSPSSNPRHRGRPRPDCPRDLHSFPTTLFRSGSFAARGARRRPTASSRRTAISSSRRCG